MLANELLRPFLDYAQHFKPFKSYYIKGLTGTSYALFAQAVYAHLKKNIVYIAKNESTAINLFTDLAALDSKAHVRFFPGYTTSYYAASEPELNTTQERSEVLSSLLHHSHSTIVITYPEALSLRVPPQKTMQGQTFELKTGMAVDLVFLQEWLEAYGFEYQDPVTTPGKFCVRGGLIDVFSFSSELPYRIEFNGDSIEQIRAFDPLNQLSVSKHAFINILPNVKAEHSQIGSSLLDYFKPETSIVIIEGLSHVLMTLEACYNAETAVYEQMATHSILKPPDHILWSPKQATSAFASYWILDCGIQDFNVHDLTSILDIQLQPQPLFQNSFQRLAVYFTQLQQQGYTIWFSAQNPKQADRLISILNDHAPQNSIVPPSWFTFLPYTLHAGFIDSVNRHAVFTDHQIFDRYHVARRSQKQTERKAGITFNELTQLQPGDYVTHIDHGVGRFAGLHKLEQQGRIQECMKILYRDQDAIYVNIQNLHRVSKYTSKEGQVPQLDKLGSVSWQNLKQKTKRKVKDLAYDLIQLYAERKKTKGFAFDPDTYLQHELEASFVFEDTPDQIKVLREIKSDMELDTPMDRLLCGDVGFGKTEIAIRSAFKAVCSGKQVAVLVPTTILAYQHFKTFSERLSHLPCKVDYVNRFRSNADQHLIRDKLKTGQLDIIIGTHRLLGKEIQYKDLGLIIIDEEQKFGVAAKDKLKLIKTQVDTLTLTATPIPRTLQFSLMGARDLSIISTPPPNRFPVQTFWHNTNDTVIQDAIKLELSRSGQVYVVNHRITDLEYLAQHIRTLVPGARVGIAHGQMEGKTLEAVMFDFMEGHLDVLVSTTIVESGLDIRNANTIIIHNAQYYGLSDLHQMRGRVGRSNKKAFCYLLTPPGLTLSSDAQKRMQAIVEFSDLGSGFQIAMRDLDIRGAGNVLGAEQSGFIQEMGFDTYMKILQEAVNELHNETGLGQHIQDANRMQFSKQLVRDVTLETDLSLYIPDTYIRNAQERLNLYRELDQLTHEDELQAFILRLQDRFGAIPEVVNELFQLIRMRWIAQALQIDKMHFKSNVLKLYLPSPKLESYYQGAVFEAILQFTQKHHYRCKLTEKHERRWLEIKLVPDVHEALKIVSEIQKKQMD